MLFSTLYRQGQVAKSIPLGILLALPGLVLLGASPTAMIDGMLILPSLILNGMPELISKTTLFQEAHAILFQSPTVSWLRLVHVEFSGVAGTAKKGSLTHLFLRAVFKGNSSFPVGRPRPDQSPKPSS